MSTKIQKWGNSLGVRIPKNIADALGLEEGDAVEVQRADEGDKVVLKKSGSEYTLDELLEGVSPETIHGQLDCGEPKGKEVW